MTARSGLTLVEVMVAMLIFSVGALGLAAGSAVILRQMSSSQARMHSAAFARSRAEKFSASCASIANGEDRKQGVRSTWQVTEGAAATLDQQMERIAADRTRTDRYLSAALCD